MASHPNVTITILTELRETEPDGNPCSCCEDVIYLRELTMYVRLQTPLERLGRPIPVRRFCQSCADALKDMLPELKE